MMSKIKEKTIEIVAEQLQIGKDEIYEETSFSDLGADSLDLTEMVMAFEETFDVEISDEDAKNLPTVGDVINKLESTTTV